MILDSGLLFGATL